MPRRQEQSSSDQKPSEATGTPRATIVVLNLPVPDDRRVWAEAEALRDDGVAVTVVCPALRGKTAGRAVIDGIDVVYFRSFEGTGRLATVVEGIWNTVTASRLAKRSLGRPRGGASRRAPAMVQVCNPPDSLYRLLAWARRKGVLTVYDQHDVVPALAGSRASFRRLLPLLEHMERKTIAAADVVLTPSQEQVGRLAARFDRRAVVVRTAPVVAAATAPSRGDSPSGPVRLGYLGVIGEQDGVDELIEAVRQLRARGVDGFEVDVAGDGPYLPLVRERVAALEAGDPQAEGTVRLRGWLDATQLDAFLDGIDAMVVPDPDIEFNHYCAMNKVTHAMARAIPVVLRPLRENLTLVGGDGFVAKDMSLTAFADVIADFLAATDERRAATGRRLRESYERRLSWSFFKPIYLDAVSPARVPTGARRAQADLRTEISDLASPDALSERNSESGK